MCGWLAMWRPGGALPDDGVLGRLRDVMAPRGPDEAGLWRGGDVALAHRRLAVIDVSPTGRQPLARLGVRTVFNGEIYNHRALRAELTAAGAVFAGRSDTEILPVGLRVWGFRRLLEKLDGMFAFALWDEHERTLLLARDRCGEKPLYYSLTGGLTAASELRVVAGALGRAPAFDPGILPLYLYHGFIPAPWTPYREVAKLPPATGLVARLREGAVVAETFSYWHLDYEPKEQLTFDDAVEELDGRLRSAVVSRMAADVPVGAFLSGGVDSSAVVSYAAEAAPGLRTFAVGFTHQRYNELPFARRVADHLGTRHHEALLEVDVLGSLPAVAAAHGEPFADSSAVPSLAVARAARRHVTVVLTGDGGDEAFAGYPNARAAWIAGLVRARTGDTARRRAERLLRLGASPRAPAWLRRLWAASRYAARPRGEFYLDPDLWRDDLRAGLLTADVKRRALLGPAGWHALLAADLHAASELDRYLAADLLVRLPNDYLCKVDTATMGAGLEARAPFLAPEVLTFAARLPRRLLLPLGEPKGLLKALAARRVPPASVYRPKAGFALPLGPWLRGPFRRPVEELLFSAPALARGWFEPAAVRRVWHAHVAGKADHTARLWALMALETWARIYLDGARPSAGLAEAA
jgi:asparagine synthase (glutamine-hydrolysing)